MDFPLGHKTKALEFLVHVSVIVSRLTDTLDYVHKELNAAANCN
jgi:hypothetical protein